MEVFKNEGNVSQDANFRAHLDDNWDSGNREFDKVEDQLRTALDDIQFLKKSISAVKEQLSDYINTQDKLNKNYDQRLQRLEAAIFNAEYINDTDNKPDIDHSTKVSEINDDIVPDPSTNDSSAVVIESDNDAIIPDKIN